MFQVRIHGRGGQGVVTAAELLAVAAFDQGRHAQAFPSFGSERTGAPVVSYCRIDDHEIRTREPIDAPDAVIVQDVTLVHHVDLFGGLRPAGYVLVNTSLPLGELGLDGGVAGLPDGHVAGCPATELALAHVGRAVPNVPLLGAFCALTGEVPLEALARALRQRFPREVAERNVEAAGAAFDLVSEHQGVHHAPTA
jgi:pyruvate ferredoxin oxidoreductase gamma subunit